MRFDTLLAVLGGFLTLAGASPVSSKSVHGRQDGNATTPCALASQALFAANGTAISSTLPAKIAFDCLHSVPFNATSAKLLLKDMVPYIQWQSTLTVLANPPAEYVEKVQPSIDILGGLDKISADIDAGVYKSEYDFGWSVYTLIQSAHDGHFSFIPDSVGGVFNFGRPVPIVSVSEDGQKLPSVFAFEDVLGMQFKNISYTPSAITEINGQDVIDYLEDFSQYGSLQDRDALYNNLFYSLPQVALTDSGSGTGMFTGGGRGRFVYPGPVTVFTFANGTTRTVENYARVLGSFRNIASGEDVADRFFYFGQALANQQARIEALSTETTVAAAATYPGYPVPIVPGPGFLINGFYVDAAGYEDVAVLHVPNFVGLTSIEVAFQKTTQDFLAKAKADGKTKLIIDVQANGGGTILQGYDMFKQLFPTIEPYGANRWRAIEALDLIGQSYSAFGSQSPRTVSNATLKQVQSTYFDYHTDMDVNGDPFTSWPDKFGPVQQLGDNYTEIARWNLSDVFTSYNSGGINITGYGPLANASREAPFEAANIVLLTDGYCASTCTIFSEFLTQQAGVKTIAMGGRSNRNKIQAIGGVKGVNNFQWGYLQSLAKQAIYYAPDPDLKQSLNSSILSTDYLSYIPYSRSSTSPGVNNRDGLRQNDTSGIPLQFIYEEADCRLYYTPEMTVDATAMWKAAADAQWGSSGKCVSGGGYGRRETTASAVTASLSLKKTARVKGMSQAKMLKQFEAFERTFGLETDCRMSGEGFMQP